MFQTNFVEKIKKNPSHSNFFFLTRAVYEIMRKTFVERDRSQMTIWRMRIAFWITEATHTLRICNTYCFSTATTVARTRLNVTFIRTLPVLHNYCSNKMY
jgi:hypothetical protein